MCTKRSYQTRDQSIYALRQLQRRKLEGTIKDMCWAKRAYWCSDCGGWHLTKQDLRRSPIASDVLPGDY